MRGRDADWWLRMMSAMSLAARGENDQEGEFGMNPKLLHHGTILRWNPYQEPNSFDTSRSPRLDDWEWAENRPGDIPFCDLHNMSETEAAKKMVRFIIHHLIIKYTYSGNDNILRICPGKGTGFMSNEMMKVLAVFPEIQAKQHLFNLGLILVKL